MNIFTVTLASMLVAGAANAECEMQKFGSLPVTIQDNRIVLNGQINGHAMKFLVDTAAPGTLLPRIDGLAARVRPVRLGITL